MNEFYMCYVEHGHTAKKRHATLDLAMAEAERLSGLPDIAGRRVFVLTIAHAIEARPAIEKKPVVIVKKKRLTVKPE